jgi:hypothetical protein
MSASLTPMAKANPDGPTAQIRQRLRVGTRRDRLRRVRFGGLLIAFAALARATSALAADEQPICADRPGKATPTCTVPLGVVQIETGLVDWTRDSHTDELDFGASAVKVGLTDRLHIELDLPAYTTVRHGPSGFGDSALALKYRFTRGDAPVQLAVRPFLKIPTAGHSLGNGKVEGGVAFLADSSFANSPAGWDLAPEVDLVADADGSGYHFAMIGAASVSVPLSNHFTISGELWGAWDFDPSGTVRQYSADAAAALLLSPDLQLDAGINFGLNHAAPDLEIYSGIAVRF